LAPNTLVTQLDQDQDLILWQGYRKYTHIAIFKSRLCSSWHCVVFNSSLQNWLQHGCLLILIQQWLMFINLHPLWA